MLACDVTTSPSSASASSAWTSASCRARRRSAAMAGLEKADQTLESQPIALGAEASYHPHRGVREHRAAPLRLAREDVRQMHFHERRRVDHQPVRLPLEPLDRVDQLALVVRLRPRYLDAQRARLLARAGLDFRG